jgi:hypothetical protein
MAAKEMSDGHAPVRLLTVPYHVPYYAQIASPWLVFAFFEKRMPTLLDPHWAESGAFSLEEYVYWTNRACGAACVKMAVEALGGSQRSLLEWARHGVVLGGYLSEKREDGSSLERGWLHRTLAEMIQGEGFFAEPRHLKPDEFIPVLEKGGMIIASVSHEIGTNHPITKRGGHLVLVFGAALAGDQLQAIILHNPSGRSPALQVAARIPLDRFAAAYTGRGIVIQPFL